MTARKTTEANGERTESGSWIEAVDLSQLDHQSLLPVRAGANKRQVRQIISFWLIAADLLAIILAFGVASVVRLGVLDVDQISMMLLIVLPLFAVFSLYGDAHNAGVITSFPVSYRKGATSFALAAAALMLVVFMLQTGAEFSRLIFVFGAIGSVALIGLFRFMVDRFARNVARDGLYSYLYIYDGVPVRQRQTGSFIDTRQVDVRPDLGDSAVIRRLGLLAQGMDKLIVECQPESRTEWALALKALDVPSELVVPELTEMGPLALRVKDGQCLILLGSGQLKWSQRVTKRTFDLAFTFVTLPFLLPLFFVVGLAIKLDSPGPVFFRQERIGLGNRSFMIWKFRSMRDDLRDDFGAKSTGRVDKRVTRVGNFLRKTSIDELPQIFNILLGDMSVVGPRPHASASRAENKLFWEIDQRYWHRHAVKPGLTGLAQVRGFRGSTEVTADLSNRLQSDLEYVSKWSLLGDIRIVLQTTSVLVHRNAF